MSDEASGRQLRVLFLAEDFYPKSSGGAFIDWNTAISLAHAGDQVIVVTPKNASTPSQEYRKGVDIRRPFSIPYTDTRLNSVRGQLRRIVFLLLVLPYIIRLCWREEFDLIYSTNHLFHPIATFLGLIFRVPRITFVGYSPSQRSETSLFDPRVLIEQLNFRLFMGDRVLCRTPSVCKEISRLATAPVNRIDGIVDSGAIRDVINSSVYSPIVEGTGCSFNIVFVGRLVDIKNPLTPIEIMKQLPERYSLVIVGDGPRSSDVEAAVNEQGLNERVEIVGHLSHEKTLMAIHEADLLLLTSESESYGAVVFEALSLNTPVLATPVGVLPTIDHPNLTTAPLAEFSDIIAESEYDGGDGVDEESLNRFSVHRFTSEVRTHMVQATKQSR